MNISRLTNWGEKEKVLYAIAKQLERMTELGWKWTQGDFHQGALLNYKLPIISGINLTNSSSTGTTINATVIDATSVTIDYGLTEDYGLSVTANIVANLLAKEITELTLDTLYYFRITASNSKGLTYHYFTVNLKQYQLFDKENYQINKSLDASGNILTTANAHTTNKIYVADGETQIAFSGLSANTHRRAFYRVDNSAISVLNFTATEGVVTLPVDCDYFMFYFQNATTDAGLSLKDTLMISFGEIRPYLSYSEPYPTVLVTSNELNVYTVVPDTNPDNDETAGCTGLGYNTVTNELAVAFYNYDFFSKIWLYKKSDLTAYATTPAINPVPTRVIDVTAYIDHIQGLDYDADLNCYWVVGTIKDAESLDTNRVLIAVDDAGTLIETTPLSALSFQAGMLAVYDDSIYIKPNNTTTLLKLNKATKVLTETIDTVGYGAEGFGIDKSNGNIWLADATGGIGIFDNDMNLIAGSTFATFGNEIEGLIIDPQNKTIWIAADTFLHGANPNGNALWHYAI